MKEYQSADTEFSTNRLLIGGLLAALGSIAAWVIAVDHRRCAASSRS